MRNTSPGIGKLLCLLTLIAAISGCGGGGGSSSNGGFSNADWSIKVRVKADRTTVPANINGASPSLNLPYTTSVIVEVKTDEGNAFDDGETTAQMSVDGVNSGAISTLDDPETDENEFLELAGQTFADINSGQAQFFFTSFSKPGTVKLTASVRDPASNRVRSASINIVVEAPEIGPPSSLTFTGPFINAVLANQAYYNEDGALLLDGSYSRLISVLANDANGNPVQSGTQIDFFLVDSPLVGYPAQGAGSFFIAGDNSDPVEGGFDLTASGAEFLTKGARAFDRLVLDGNQRLSPQPDNTFQTGIRTVRNIAGNNALAIERSGEPFNERSDGADTGPTVPFIVGRAMRGALSTPSFTDENGVASTFLTYPSFRLGQTAALVACTTDRSVCGVLNTCDGSGQNCSPVYLGVTRAGESTATLTASETSLGSNTTTEVDFCVKDALLAPVPAAEILYAVGPTGSATVTVNGSSESLGSLSTGGNGCATATIASAGQIEGSPAIVLTFSLETLPGVEITIKAPGAGNLTGSILDEDPGEPGEKGVGLLLLAEDGTPIPDTRINDTVSAENEDNSCSGYPQREDVMASATVTYEHPDQLTDVEGRLDALVDVEGDHGDVVSVKFKSFGGAEFEAKFPIAQDDFIECADGPLEVSAFPSEIAPDTTTTVMVCLEDSLNRQIPNTELMYSISNTGGAEVTVNGSTASIGSVTTGDDGCTDVEISSSGVIDGSEEDAIEIAFSGDNVDDPAVVKILPFEGALTGTISGTVVDLLLVDRRTGQPISGSFITYSAEGACSVAGVSFTPTDQQTDENGRLKAAFSLSSASGSGDGGNSTSITFESAGGAQFQAQLPCPGGGGNATLF